MCFVCARLHGLDLGRPVQGSVRCGRYGKRQHLEWHPGSRERLRVPHRKSPKLFGGFVCRRRSPKLNLVISIIQTVTCPSMSIVYLVLDSTALWSGTLRLFIPFAERCLHRAVCFLKTTSWRAWIDSYLTFCKACLVTCADGNTAAEDTEVTTKCVFDLELTSM